MYHIGFCRITININVCVYQKYVRIYMWYVPKNLNQLKNWKKKCDKISLQKPFFRDQVSGVLIQLYIVLSASKLQPKKKKIGNWERWTKIEVLLKNYNSKTEFKELRINEEKEPEFYKRETWVSLRVELTVKVITYILGNCHFQFFS